MSFLEEFYETTLGTLAETKNDRLWTKTNLKLAKLWLDRGEYARLNKVCALLHWLVSLCNATYRFQWFLFKPDIETIAFVVPKWWWKWRSEERDFIVGDLCVGDSDVDWTKEQQKAQGQLEVSVILVVSLLMFCARCDESRLQIRLYIIEPFKSNRPFHILVSWVLFANVVGKCIWVKVSSA